MLRPGTHEPRPLTLNEPKMKVSIPFLRRGEERETFVRTVDDAAGAARISSEQGLAFLTYWIENVANEVCVGKPVSIPGLGKFGPWLEQRATKCNRYNGGHPYSVPVFVPSKGFRRQVKLMAPCNTKGKKSLQACRRQDSNPNGKTLVHTTTKKIREAIARQLAVAETQVVSAPHLESTPFGT